MREDLLKAAESAFLSKYPGGFNHPEMQEVSKKHRGDKMHQMALEMFSANQFGFVNEVIDNMVKIVSRSSMISVFEKPKFRDFLMHLDEDNRHELVEGLYERLHGNKEKGFNQMVEILLQGKLAKWSLISIIPYYYKPQEEAFMKPTTVKGIIKTFELENLVYRPLPSYAFYLEFKKQLAIMQKYVDPGLGPDFAAFSGFLMTVMDMTSGKE